jgi:hypothetical protein
MVSLAASVAETGIVVAPRRTDRSAFGGRAERGAGVTVIATGDWPFLAAGCADKAAGSANQAVFFAAKGPETG